MNRLLLAIFLSTLLNAPNLLSMRAWADIRRERVQFSSGDSGTTIQGIIRGYEAVEYLLTAQAGQTMTVYLTSNNRSNYFNVYEPGKQPDNDEAMYVSAINGNRYETVLPATGQYLIRVYLMRNAARRNEIANYQLHFAVKGVPNSANSNAGHSSKVRAGEGDFDATGKIPCAQSEAQPITQCDFGVARESKGTATVMITKPDGSQRQIIFIHGQATTVDQNEASSYPELSLSREGDLNFIRIGSERYEIPDAVIYGG